MLQWYCGPKIPSSMTRSVTCLVVLCVWSSSDKFNCRPFPTRPQLAHRENTQTVAYCGLLFCIASVSFLSPVCMRTNRSWALKPLPFRPPSRRSAVHPAVCTVWPRGRPKAETADSGAGNDEGDNCVHWIQKEKKLAAPNGFLGGKPRKLSLNSRSLWSPCWHWHKMLLASPTHTAGLVNDCQCTSKLFWKYQESVPYSLG